MYKFKTISVKDWLHAVEEGTSERTKTMRHKRLAIRALKEVEPFWFPKKNPYFDLMECKFSELGTYTGWIIRPFGKRGHFYVGISEAKIWIIDVDGVGNKQYPCGKPDWSLDTNLAD